MAKGARTAVPTESARAAASIAAEPAGLGLPLAVVLLLALLLTGEALLPGRVFLPLLPDDFPEWQAGRDPAVLQQHPHPNWSMSDVVHLLVPGLAVTASAVREGHLPLWDASQALGVPHLHEVHYGVLYPPAWLPLLFGLHGLALMALLHLLAAGAGTLLYLRAIGRSTIAALAGAVCFLAGAWVTTRLHSFPVVGAAVWLPWILYGLERGAQAPGFRAALRPRLIAAAAVALSLFAGFPQVTLLALATAALLEVLRAGVTCWPRRDASGLATLCAGALTLLFGVFLAFPQVLPTLDYLREDSLRREQDSQALAADALELPLLWQLLVPQRYATPDLTGGHPLALRDLQAAQVPASINSAEVAMGVGALGLLLALLAMLFGRHWRTLAFTGLAVVVLLLLCWPALLAGTAEWLPLLRYGSPRRLLLLSSFALAVLAAGGLDLARGRRLRVTVTAWALALALVGLGLAARLSVPSVEQATDVDYWAGQIATAAGPGHSAEEVLALVPRDNFRLAAEAAGRSALVCLAAGIFAVLVFRPRRSPTVEGWGTAVRSSPQLVVWALAIELCIGAWPGLRSAPTEAASTQPGRIGAWPPPVLAELAVGAGAEESESEAPVPPRVARFGNDPPWVRPNLPVLFGLSDLQCYAPMAPRRTAELLDALEPGMVLSGSAIGGFRTPASLASPLLDLLDVRALFTSDAELAAPGWIEAGRVGHVRVLANTEALPRAFVASRVEVLPDAAERLARLTAPDFDPRVSVVLEGPLDGAVSRALAGAGRGEPGTGASTPARVVTMETWQPGHVRLHVAAGAPGVLVLSEGWHDGWRAHAGGVALPVLRADHALLALPLASREDLVVTFDFDPPLVTLALLLGGVGWAAWLVLLLLGGRTPREQAGGGPAPAAAATGAAA